MSSNRPHSIHHVNFPTTNPERTKQWYAQVFGMKHVDVSALSNTKVLLMSRGNFELHFTPIEEMRRMAPFHYAVEVEDWDGFLAHLKSWGSAAPRRWSGRRIIRSFATSTTPTGP